MNSCVISIKCGCLNLTDQELHLNGLNPNCSLSLEIKFNDTNLYSLLDEAHSTWWMYFQLENISYKVN